MGIPMGIPMGMGMGWVRGLKFNPHSSPRAAVGMGIPMGIPMGMGIGWVWGLKFNPHGSPAMSGFRFIRFVDIKTKLNTATYIYTVVHKTYH